MKIYTNDLVKGHSDFKVKCLTFGLYTQVSDSGPLGPLVYLSKSEIMFLIWINQTHPWSMRSATCKNEDPAFHFLMIFLDPYI